MKRSHFSHKYRHQKGQSLVEYLIIVAIMGVATLSVLRLLQHTVDAKFAQVIYSLQGKPQRVQIEAVDQRHYKKKDLSDFMTGAARKNKGR